MAAGTERAAILRDGRFAPPQDEISNLDRSAKRRVGWATQVENPTGPQG